MFHQEYKGVLKNQNFCASLNARSAKNGQLRSNAVTKNSLFNTPGDDTCFMQEALLEARRGFDMDEVPIGCVIVYDGKIIGRGANERMTRKNVLRHAEITAINQACEVIGDWRLEECTLYVTLEPCPMCAGAIVQARIPEVVYGAKNPKAGCAGSVLDILNEPRFNHQVKVTSGVCEEECAGLMTEFFKRFRAGKCVNGN